MTDDPEPIDAAPQELWNKARVLREAQTLYTSSAESKDKLKCLEMILELLPPEKRVDQTTVDMVTRVRKSVGRPDGP